jgi:hypothetical protein
LKIDEKENIRRRRQETSKHESEEPKFANISGAQESIPRNLFLGSLNVYKFEPWEIWPCGGDVTPPPSLSTNAFCR